MDLSNLRKLEPAQLLAKTSIRDGETKLGQAVSVLEEDKDLSAAVKRGIRYGIIGVAEDIGPRANLGRGGADGAWAAFLPAFCNIQSNSFLSGKETMILGEVELADLMQSAGAPEVSTETLRGLCAQIDDRLAPIVKSIVQAGLEPIVVSGGNNNSYPTIKGTVEALRALKVNRPEIACVNVDAHADYRALEGRHSGNPFSYAEKDGYLKGYCVFALMESYNNVDMLTRMKERGFKHKSYDHVIVRQDQLFDESVNEVCGYLYENGYQPAIELDVDVVAGMPSSAQSPVGLTAEQALNVVHNIASRFPCRYFHVSEGAPRWDPQGERIVGRMYATAVVTYIKARESYRRRNG